MTKHPTIEGLIPINSKCPRCSLCKFPPLVAVESKEHSMVCPSYREYMFHSHSGGGRVVMAISLLRGRGQITDETRDAIYQCNLCGGCDVACKYSSDIEIMEMLYALRAESFRLKGPLAGHADVLEGLRGGGINEAEGNAVQGWVEEAGLSAGMNGTGTLLFVGRRYARRKEHRQTLLNLVRLLRSAGVAFGVLGADEPPTGMEALEIGDQDLFNELAVQAVEKLRACGATRVVCPDPDELNAFRAHVPKAADLTGIEFVPAVELLDTLVKKNKIRPRKRVNAKVAYHDPCKLGRLSEPFRDWNGQIKKIMGQLVIYDPPRPVNRGASGCYEPPRRLLRSIPGLELKEFHRRREYAFCCGGGGMARQAGYEAFVANTAVHRAKEAASVGADLIATACPGCVSALKTAEGGAGIPVRDVIDLLAESVTG
jgi:Fe-S oxidoreductase